LFLGAIWNSEVQLRCFWGPFGIPECNFLFFGAIWNGLKGLPKLGHSGVQLLCLQFPVPWAGTRRRACAGNQRAHTSPPPVSPPRAFGIPPFGLRWRRGRSVVERCSMTRDASTAAGGCLTDRTIMPALPMPYNGDRVVFASRASSLDEGRGAHAK
jgi:hypothetical protein